MCMHTNIWSCFVFLFVLFTCLFKTGDFSSLCSELIAFSRAYLHPVLLKTSKGLSEPIDWNFFSVVSALGRNVGRGRMVPPQMCLEDLQNKTGYCHSLGCPPDLMEIFCCWRYPTGGHKPLRNEIGCYEVLLPWLLVFYGNRRFCASWGEMPSMLHLTTNTHSHGQHWHEHYTVRHSSVLCEWRTDASVSWMFFLGPPGRLFLTAIHMFHFQKRKKKSESPSSYFLWVDFPFVWLFDFLLSCVWSTRTWKTRTNFFNSIYENVFLFLRSSKIQCEDIKSLG